MLARRQRITFAIETAECCIVDRSNLSGRDHGVHFVPNEIVKFESYQPDQIVMIQEMMEQQHCHETVTGADLTGEQRKTVPGHPSGLSVPLESIGRLNVLHPPDQHLWFRSSLAAVLSSLSVERCE